MLVSLFAPPTADTLEDFLTSAAVRFPGGLVIAAIFKYAADQSSDHRKREMRAKQLGMELTTFRPFLAELPVKDQHELTVAATARFFRGSDDKNAGNSAEDSADLAKH